MGLNSLLHILLINEKYEESGIERANYVSTGEVRQPPK